MPVPVGARLSAPSCLGQLSDRADSWFSKSSVWLRYGPDAGQASRDLAAAGYSAASTVRSVSQIRRLGATSVARKVARRTAKGIVKSWVKPVQVPLPDGTQPPPPQPGTQPSSHSARPAIA